MILLIIFFFFNFLNLFLNQNLINLIGFLTLYVFLISFYKKMGSYSSELESSTWVELIRTLLLLRSWAFFCLRYTELELFSLFQVVLSFQNNLSRLLIAQQDNVYVNYLDSLVLVVSSIHSRLVENEIYFDTYTQQAMHTSSLVRYI